MAPKTAFFCLLLLTAAVPASARTAAGLEGSGAGGGCPTAAEEDAEAASPNRDDKRAPVAGKPKTQAVRRGGDAGANGRAPRWHSFLPGMIR